MNPVTIDLIATILTCTAAIVASGFAIWVLPWSETDWLPRPAKARLARRPRRAPPPVDLLLDAPTAH